MFLVLQVGDETFAIEVEKAREVIRVPKLSWVPGAHESMKGVINFRGTIIAILDLALLLGLPAGDAGDRERIIILESAGSMVGLLVDAVNEVTAVPTAQLEATMQALDENQRSLVTSQVTIRERIVGILDIDQVVANARGLQPQSD